MRHENMRHAMRVARMARVVSGLLGLAAATMTYAQQSRPAQEIPLYAGPIPGAIEAPDEEKVRDPQEAYPFLQDISRPTLTVYLPAQPDANHAGVIILPGGSYRGVSIKKEGHDIAKQLNELGIAAFVLKYRTPDPKHMKDRTLGPL